MEEIKAYHCDYCRKYSISKQYIKKHEANCFYNPETRSCASCNHLKEEKHSRPSNRYTLMPVCSAGICVATIDDSEMRGYTLTLKHHCQFWEAKPIEEEEES